MPGRAVLPNQPQVGIGEDRQLEGDDPVLPFLEGAAPRRSELFVAPSLDGGLEELPNGGPQLNNLQAVRHLVAGPVVAVNPAVQIHPNALLQQMEQEDLRAVQNLLELFIPNNVITAQHLWRIMRNLRAILPEEGPYRIRSSQAEYARILRRTAGELTIPSREMFETAMGRHHSLGYDTRFQALQDSTPECPTEYGECLDKLCVHLTAGGFHCVGSLKEYQVHSPATGSLMSPENNIVNLYETNGKEDQPFFRISKTNNSSTGVEDSSAFIGSGSKRRRVCIDKSYTARKFGLALARKACLCKRERHDSLGYYTLFQALQDSTPECPAEYGECLDKVCDRLTAAASLMPGAGGVFIFKDPEDFGYSLWSLAARLT